MYKLYYTTRSYTTESTSLIPRIALEEIGAAYEVVEVELDPAPPDWYLAINPHGKAPSLEGPDGEIVYPSAAILLYLADRHPEAGLLPAEGAARAAAYRTLLDLCETLMSSYMQFFFTARISTDEADIPAIRAKAVEWLARYWAAIDTELADSANIAGAGYSICDIYLYVLARWYVDVCSRVGEAQPPFGTLRNVIRFCELIESRPAVARSLAADDILAIASADPA